MTMEQSGKLEEDAIVAQLSGLPQWKRKDDHIVRQFDAKDARHALRLIQRIGDLAEGAGHHPELEWVYRHLRIALTTHDASGLTIRDFHLAGCIEDVLEHG